MVWFFNVIREACVKAPHYQTSRVPAANWVQLTQPSHDSCYSLTLPTLAQTSVWHTALHVQYNATNWSWHSAQYVQYNTMNGTWHRSLHLTVRTVHCASLTAHFIILYVQFNWRTVCWNERWGWHSALYVQLNTMNGEADTVHCTYS